MSQLKELVGSFFIEYSLTKVSIDQKICLKYGIRRFQSAGYHTYYSVTEII